MARPYSREILALRRRKDGVFEFYEDGNLVEEWVYNDPEEAWGYLIVKTLRHLRNIADKRLRDISSPHFHYWEDGTYYSHSHKGGDIPHGHHGSKYGGKV